MSKITDITEPWEGHTLTEIEVFIKETFEYSPPEPSN